MIHDDNQLVKSCEQSSADLVVIIEKYDQPLSETRLKKAFERELLNHYFWKNEELGIYAFLKNSVVWKNIQNKTHLEQALKNKQTMSI
ncbi:hypothetical protein [Basilea psittacipulmonis]|uniref:Uncharacterized protein n=1 Tax=Basilea psittacipulmonis DSM 24701 TaxID=1072685 RepID=A0A077DE63_9BURK|nr:hypothetical protein [Basilea psittacipulmonis]AIL32969.1 hypothetical protein IX83_06265 [Basilea psittacipulmonis DSM 24701]